NAFGPKSGLRSASYSPSGGLIVLASESASHAGTVWNTDTLVRFGRLPDPAGIEQARFSPDGEKIVCASLDGKVRIWNVRSSELEKELSLGTNAIFADFSHDGRFIAAAGRQGIVKIWNTNGEATGLAFRNPNWVTYLGFSPDDQRIV